MSGLAIVGGDPVAPEGLETDWPIYDETDRAGIESVLESGRWCSAEYLFVDGQSHVSQFEAEFAAYIGTTHATAVPNGTQALQLAFRAIGVEPGDEVIVPAVTFVASASAVVLEGGTPVFVDVDPETYQLSPDAVAAAITDRTKAIEVVHYAGYPADMDRIIDIATEHDLYVIEDAAEAHGTEWRGERVGSIGDIGCFSLQLGKSLTCGEGGVLTYEGGELADAIYTHTNLGRPPGGGPYDHVIPAGNYRLSEFLGALSLAQLARLDEQTDRRDAHGRYFAEQVSEIDGLAPLKADERITKRGYYFCFLRYDASRWGGRSRKAFRAALAAEGIDTTTAHNEPLYHYPAFAMQEDGDASGRSDHHHAACPTAERIYREEVIALSKDILLERSTVETVVAALEKLRTHANDIPEVDEQ